MSQSREKRQRRRSVGGFSSGHRPKRESHNSVESDVIKNALLQHNDEKVALVREHRISQVKGGSQNRIGYKILSRSGSQEKSSSVELPEKNRRASSLFHESLPAGKFKYMLQKMPSQSYIELSSKESPITNNVENKLTGMRQRMVDVFFNDFFFLRDDKKHEGQYLLYLYIPDMSPELVRHVSDIQRLMTMSSNGLEHMKYVGAAETAFQHEKQGITDKNRNEIIRVAFKVKNGQLDPYCRAVLEEYPILSLPANAEWPLIRILVVSAQEVKHKCFMKRGNLSDMEIQFMTNRYIPAASAICFLDRGETGRNAVLSAEEGGQIRLNTNKVINNRRRQSNGYSHSDYAPEKRCVVNGRIVLRLAANNSNNRRKLLPTSRELDAMKAEGKDFLKDANEYCQRRLEHYGHQTKKRLDPTKDNSTRPIRA